MGVQPKLEEFDGMDQDPPPLGRNKIGFNSAIQTTSADDMSNSTAYEILQPPVSMKSHGHLPYPCRSMSLNFYILFHFSCNIYPLTACGLRAFVQIEIPHIG